MKWTVDVKGASQIVTVLDYIITKKINNYGNKSIL